MSLFAGRIWLPPYTSKMLITYLDEQGRRVRAGRGVLDAVHVGNSWDAEPGHVNE